MPIFRAGARIYYFAHVPKCGGTSVELALQEAGFPLSFRDTRWRGKRDDGWYRTSPQHIPLRHLTDLFDPGLFDHSFAIVRNPVDRFLSAFNHNRTAGRIRPLRTIPEFLDRLTRTPDFQAEKFDNHFLPAARFIPDTAQVFHLEDGMQPVSDWLHRTSEGAIGIEIGHRNQRDWAAVPAQPRNRLNPFAKPKAVAVALNDLDTETRQRILQVYAEDIDRFHKDRA